MPYSSLQDLLILDYASSHSDLQQLFFIFLEHTQLSLSLHLFIPLVGTLFDQIVTLLPPRLQTSLTINLLKGFHDVRPEALQPAFIADTIQVHCHSLFLYNSYCFHIVS